MNTSDNIAALATALSAAQGELTNIGKGKLNPHLKSRYADIGDGLEVVRPILSKHGLAVVQTTQMNPDGGFLIWGSLWKGRYFVQRVSEVSPGR